MTQRQEYVCKCGTTGSANPRRVRFPWLCRKCAIAAKWADPNYREARKSARIKKQTVSKQKPKTAEERRMLISEAMRQKWLDPEYRSKMTARLRARWQNQKFRDKYFNTRSTKEFIDGCRNRSKALWDDPAFRAKYGTKDHKAVMQAATRLLWQDQAYRSKVLNTKSTEEFKSKMAIIQSSPDYIAKLSAAIAKSPRISSIQRTLYGILDDLGIKYFKETPDGADAECMLGPWTFDCAVPKANKTVLIECQGEYFHGRPDKIKADKAKATYVTTYYAETHELRYLWEHEFLQLDKVRSSLEYWLGLKPVTITPITFDDLVITSCEREEYLPFLAKYHYLHSNPRGGQAFTARYGTTIVAVAIFSPLNRAVGDIGAVELSRFCIHPDYRIANLGTWFLSKAIKMLPDNIKSIVSFADSTFNHNGALYRAANFVEVSKTAADYWYRSDDGWVMHKKTLYNQAVKMGMPESEYAAKHKMTKVFGFEKTKFVYYR